MGVGQFWLSSPSEMLGGTTPHIGGDKFDPTLAHMSAVLANTAAGANVYGDDNTKLKNGKPEEACLNAASNKRNMLQIERLSLTHDLFL